MQLNKNKKYDNHINGDSYNSYNSISSSQNRAVITVHVENYETTPSIRNLYNLL
jgi:hypothetical protein